MLENVRMNISRSVNKKTFSNENMLVENIIKSIKKKCLVRSNKNISRRKNILVRVVLRKEMLIEKKNVSKKCTFVFILEKTIG